MSDHLTDAPQPTTACGHQQAVAGVTRRRVVAGGAGVGAACLLAACGSGSDSAAPSGGGSSSEGSSDGGGSEAGSSTTQGVPVGDVAVGSGVVMGDSSDPYVVTQPSEGTFKAFTAVCTHTGCTVGRVEDNRIICPCHGSEFSAETGENVAGPSGGDANLAPLAEKTVTDEGGTLVVGA